MKILLSNDDGINSEGLWRAAQALGELGEVTIVAPDREQSGVGTSVSLHSPVRIRSVKIHDGEFDAIAVEGTPADSVILALEKVVGKDIDLVVAGINQGSNLGEDVFISGTVGAALQGYVRGKPVVAISVTALEKVRYEVASALLKPVCKMAFGLSKSGNKMFLNVNVPNIPIEQIAGVKITSLGQRSWTETVKEGEDGRRKWYWISRDRAVHDIVDGTDIWALRNKFVSMTPLHTDLTANYDKETYDSMMKELSGIFRSV